MMCELLTAVNLVFTLLFFVKQKTAYGMRMSDWSSDVCSSDLPDGKFHESGGGLSDPLCRARLRLAGRPQGLEERHDLWGAAARIHAVAAHCRSGVRHELRRTYPSMRVDRKSTRLNSSH